MSKPRVRSDDRVIKEVRERYEGAPKGHVRKVVTIYFRDRINPRTCRTVKTTLYKRKPVEQSWTQGGNAVGMKICAPAKKINRLITEMVKIAGHLASKYSREVSPNKQPARPKTPVRRSERRGPVHRVDWSSNRLAAP